MSDDPRPDAGAQHPTRPDGRPIEHPPALSSLDVYEVRNEAEAFLEPESPTAQRVSWKFLLVFWLVFVGVWLPVLAPILVTLAVKINTLVPPEQAGASLGTVVSIGGLLALVSSPFFGRLSDRTTSRFGMRRPWILGGFIGGAVGTVVMATATNVPTLALGFAIAQCFFNATLAGMYGVLADQVPSSQRGIASGLIGASLPISLPAGAYIVQLVSPDQTAMFLLPAAIGALPLLLFVLVLKDRVLAPADKPAFSWSQFFGSFWVNPIRHRDFGWVWWAKFFFVLAYAFLTTYQALFLIQELGQSTEDVPNLIFRATLVLSALTLVSSLVGGKLSDVLGRRKIFVIVASVIYGAGLYVITTADTFDTFLVGVAIAGFGFGAWAAVDTALTVDVLPSPATAAKDLAVSNIAATLPQSLAPALAVVILGASSNSYSVLYLVAAAFAVFSALFILPIKKVR